MRQLLSPSAPAPLLVRFLSLYVFYEPAPLLVCLSGGSEGLCVQIVERARATE
jgi:hypothetical protein